MKRQHLRAKAARKYKATTNSKHNFPVAPNVLQQDFSAETPNQKWVLKNSKAEHADHYEWLYHHTTVLYTAYMIEPGVWSFRLARAVGDFLETI